MDAKDKKIILLGAGIVGAALLFKNKDKIVENAKNLVKKISDKIDKSLDAEL